VGVGVIAAVRLISNVISPTSPEQAARTISYDLTGTRKDDTPAALTDRFGDPDEEYSSGLEHPRPPIVTLMLTYRRERVRAIHRANVPIGAPPPYDGTWRLIGFTDPLTTAALDSAAVLQRL
jgi:hypothetical protein